jgi:hypothetical protein
MDRAIELFGRLMNNCVRPAILASLAAVLLGTAGAEAAMIIDGFNAQANDRFANHVDFIGGGQSWSGVAITDTISERWLTMISPNVFLSANHYHPATGASVTLYASNDPAGAAVTRTVSGGQRVGSSDLWIGSLDAPVGVGYTYYEYATEPITSGAEFGSSVYSNDVAYLVGRSPSGRPASQDMTVGRNLLDVWFVDVTAGGATDDALGATRDSSGDPDYQLYESYLQGGDSGGPLFVEDSGAPGGLRLIGINWFIAADNAEPPNSYSGFSYVGNYADDIQTYLAVTSVPEPRATALAVGLMILGYGLVRRRARASRPAH